MTNYVVGFLFRKDATEVALIEKQRPKWQKGLHNGIGGKIELTDNNPSEAMDREFLEETGAELPGNGWKYFHTIEGADFNVFCFYAFNGDNVKLQTMETEIVKWVAVQDVMDGKLLAVHNLKELIELAMLKPMV